MSTMAPERPVRPVMYLVIPQHCMYLILYDLCICHCANKGYLTWLAIKNSVHAVFFCVRDSVADGK